MGAPTFIDLTNEIDSVAGRQLRLRVITIEPGGVVALHSHNGRPAVAYTLQGTLTEHVENGGVHEREQGESWSEGRNITHWPENKGDKPVALIAVDVFKPRSRKHEPARHGNAGQRVLTRRNCHCNVLDALF